MHYTSDNALARHAKNRKATQQEHTTEAQIGTGKGSCCILTGRTSPSCTARVGIQRRAVSPAFDAVEMIDVIAV